MLTLYNTLAHKKQKFNPISGKQVNMYSCGPTVYSVAHIGNFRAYLAQDILKRALLHEGYIIKHVMNITDVGHLVGDANLGEDKIKLAAEKEHKTARDVANFYTKIFLKDMKLFCIIEPERMPKATDHIPEMLALIQSLDDKQYLYTAETGIYFDTSRLKDYGKLSKMTFAKLSRYLKAGVRVERASGLKNITDFAVWRFRKRESESDMIWDSQWGQGFPGWHIECSAMSLKYLGNTFDIHCGGIDHIPIHHTNEIAQSEAVTGQQFVNYWFHNNFLTVDGMKMAKSLRNIYSLGDLMEKGFKPADVRYMLISGHYRKKLNFTIEALENVSNTVRGIYLFMQRLKEIKGKGDGTREFAKKVSAAQKGFFRAINNDLNVPAALSYMHLLVSEANKRSYVGSLGAKDAKLVAKVMLDFDSILGLGLEEHYLNAQKKIPPEAMRLIDEREAARRSKEFKHADSIRAELKEKFGITIEDTKDGVKWH
ncbi:MAG: cysteine--tRNA ligase [Candidatus Micrarchaeota archaeon]|nr:cysteine--tRNA ligase [Candidatus Micrarchaeota archaeon]MDE1847961.1 cysteine--tRNA ligase [Candidatus Micrarchaeota archaeon]MDE1864321.1 cysteine--tRNA ligase [Candidatus Micrarchaeota archaeon]